MRRSSRTHARKRASVKPCASSTRVSAAASGIACGSPRAAPRPRSRPARPARSAAPRAGSARDRPAARRRRSDRIGDPVGASIRPSASAARASLSVIGWPPTSASVRSIKFLVPSVRTWTPGSRKRNQQRKQAAAHQNACPSEMCSTFDRSRPPVSSQARAQLPAPVDAQRPDRRSIPEPDAARHAHLVEANVAGVLEDVAGIEEPHELQVLPVRRARFEIEDRHAVAALRESLRIERLVGAEAIEREAAHGGVAAGEEALARRQILDRRRKRLGAIDRASGSTATLGAAAAARRSRAAAECPAKSRPPGRGARRPRSPRGGPAGGDRRSPARTS